MALEEIVDPLNSLLSRIQRGKGIQSHDPGSDFKCVFLISRPPVVRPSPGTSMLWLTDETAQLYCECLAKLFQEGEDGELEHLPQRDIERELLRLVWETWLQRNELRSRDRRNKVDDFIATNRVPHQEWEVLWQIEDLHVVEPLRFGDIEFFRFPDERARRFLFPPDHPWRSVEEELFGRAFARVVVHAGAKNRALERGMIAIDDALNMMRAALVSKVREEQLLQRWGFHYYAAPLSDHQQGIAGAVRERGPFPLEIGGVFADTLRDWPIGRVFDPSFPPELREMVTRSLLWVGLGVTSENHDIKVVHLCTALECLLSHQDDRWKGSLALRYMLLALAVGEGFSLYPQEILELYQMRNEVIHGSAHRICGERDYRDLQRATLEALEWIVTLVAQHPQIQHRDDLFLYILDKNSLQKAKTCLRESIQTNATSNLSKLIDDWIKNDP